MCHFLTEVHSSKIFVFDRPLKLVKLAKNWSFIQDDLYLPRIEKIKKS